MTSLSDSQIIFCWQLKGTEIILPQQCMPDSRCPTKTLSEHGDMEKRHLFHVPANFLFPDVAEAKPTTSPCQLLSDVDPKQFRPIFDPYRNRFLQWSSTTVTFWATTTLR